jgi:hypothetical protein
MKKENSSISDKLDTVKFDEELYRIYLQEISKRFILNNNFGPDVMPMVTDMGKFLAADWQAAAERAGVSVAELKKRQEQRHKERQELKTKENEKKEQEKTEKTKEQKTNRERLVRQISAYANGDKYDSFHEFKPNFGKLVDLVKTNISNLDGTDFHRSKVTEILRDIKFPHNSSGINIIELDPSHDYNVESFYISFGRLRKFKLELESDFEKDAAKFFELFAEKLAEVFSDALELGSSGKKLILDKFYRNPGWL